MVTYSSLDFLNQLWGIISINIKIKICHVQNAWKMYSNTRTQYWGWTIIWIIESLFKPWQGIDRLELESEPESRLRGWNWNGISGLLAGMGIRTGIRICLEFESETRCTRTYDGNIQCGNLNLFIYWNSAIPGGRKTW